MKTERYGVFKRLTALLLTTVLLAGVFTLGAFASSNEDSTVWNTIVDYYWKSSDEKKQAYQELCERYPERADVHYALSTCLYGEEEARELDKAIELAEKNPKKSWRVYSGVTVGDLMEKACGRKAELCLSLYQDQEGYLVCKRKELDVGEKQARLVIDSGVDWSGATDDLQEIEAERAQLKEIERWYQAGGTGSYQGWGDRVQLNVSGDKKNIKFTMADEKTTELDATFEKPLEAVLVGVDRIYLVTPKENVLNAKVIYHNADGSVEEKTDFNERYYVQHKDGTLEEKISQNVSLYESGDIDVTEFYRGQNIEVPSEVRDFMQKNPSQETSCVWYRISTVRV